MNLIVFDTELAAAAQSVSEASANLVDLGNQFVARLQAVRSDGYASDDMAAAIDRRCAEVTAALSLFKEGAQDARPAVQDFVGEIAALDRLG